MAKSKKKVRKSKAIVSGYLEKVSSNVFEDFPQQLTGLIKKGQGQGVYALYRRDKLYYIGLASDLRRRIKWHLKDKHKGKWDRFSLYMIRKTDHIREVEALLVRIVEPKGNKQRGKLGRSKNLKRELDIGIKQKQEEERIKILDGDKRKIRRRKIKKTKVSKTDRPLKDKFPGGKVVYAAYKGKEYKAWVNRLGRISFNSKHYDTPTAAAKAIITKGAVNGWRFWKYKDKKGNLLPLKNLRH